MLQILSNPHPAETKCLNAFVECKERRSAKKEVASENPRWPRTLIPTRATFELAAGLVVKRHFVFLWCHPIKKLGTERSLCFAVSIHATHSVCMVDV